MNAPHERTTALPLILLLLLATATRLGGLGEGYWIDEVISADTAAMGLGELLARSGLADVHPPGYYLLLKLWSLLAGPSDLAGRLLTLLISVATVAMVTLYASERFGRLASLIAGLTLALSPVHAHYGVEVRSYALLTLLTVSALWCQERLLDQPTCSRRRALFVLTLSGLTWTHNLGLIFAGLILAHALLSAPVSVQGTLRALGTCVAALFTPWLPLLLVQVFHQPEGMTAHLSAPLSALDLAAGLGPAALWELPWLPGLLGALLWVSAALAWWREPIRQGAESEGMSLRGWWVFAIVVGLTGPLLALVALPLSALTFDLIAGEVGLAYGLFVLSALGIWGLGRLGGARGSFRLSAPAFLLLGSLVILAAVHTFRPLVNLRNLSPLVPLVLLGLGLWVRSQPRAAVAVAVLWIGVSASSLSSLIDRAADGPIPARDDLRGAATLVDDPGGRVVVIPRWDAPGVARYLDPDREIVGALDPAEIDLAHGGRLSVVLTREAAGSPEAILQALEAGLPRGVTLVERRQLRGAPAVEVVRYAPADREQQ